MSLLDIEKEAEKFYQRKKYGFYHKDRLGYSTIIRIRETLDEESNEVKSFTTAPLFSHIANVD